jgi:hypothetical protein
LVNSEDFVVRHILRRIDLLHSSLP